MARDEGGPTAAEQATARFADQRFSLMVDAVSEYAVFLLDPEGKVASWNAGAERIKGYAEHEIVGRHFEVFYTDEDRAAALPAEQLAAAGRHGQARSEGWRVRRDGSLFWADVVLTALRDDDGAVVGFVKITRDETDRRVVAEQSRQLDLLAVRDRIGEELRESILKRVFGAGLHLQGALRLTDDPALRQRLEEVIGELDGIIGDIRRAIAGLEAPAPD